jgi:hypothetical protein
MGSFHFSGRHGPTAASAQAEPTFVDCTTDRDPSDAPPALGADKGASDGGGGARDRGEADGAPGEGGQRSAAGIVRGAGVAVLGAAARD